MNHGEVFFDVSKNKEKPFIIHNKELETIVCGTSFNIEAYEELDVIVITVRTGLVKVNRGGKELAALTPYQQLTYNTRTKIAKVDQVDWEDAKDWMDGRLVLKNADFKELKFRMKQYFSKELEFQDKTEETICLTTSFSQGISFPNAMERICELYNMKYKTEGNRVILYR